jgi:hypothetical protein
MFDRHYNDGRVPAIWTAVPRYLVRGQFVVLSAPRSNFLWMQGMGRYNRFGDASITLMAIRL